MMRKESTRYLIQLALLSALMVVMACTPIGFVPVGPVRATTMHIPVIIGAILMGPRAGALLGTVFGTISLVRATLYPTVVAFCYSPFIPLPGMDGGSPLALLVAYVPRILIGVFSGLLYRFLSQRKGESLLWYSLCGVVGSATNTVLGMGLIYLLFGQAYAQATGVSFGALIGVILGVVCTNGTVEAIVSAVVTGAVCVALSKVVPQPA